MYKIDFLFDRKRLVFKEGYGFTYKWMGDFMNGPINFSILIKSTINKCKVYSFYFRNNLFFPKLPL